MIYLILLAVNILFVYLIRIDKKYWILSIPLWIILISGFIIWRILSDKQIQNLETEYWKTTETRGWGDYDKWTKLEGVKKNAQKLNMILMCMIGLQTFITFIFQILGQKRTTQKVYKWTTIVFGILFLSVFILIVMMNIIPYGYVT